MIENEEEILNIPNNKSKINEVCKKVYLRINFISNNIQVNSPKTDSHLISIDNRHKNKDSEIKADRIIKKSNNKDKYQEKTNNNKLIISSEKDKDINQNEEVYLYYNNINPKINKSFNQNILLYFILSRINENKNLKCNILLKNNNYILYSNSGKFMLSAKEDFSFFHKNFEIYTSRDFSNSSIIARLHSYSRNTEFILYDKGISPYKNKNIVGENKQN